MSEEPVGRKPNGLLSTDALRAAFQAQSAFLEKFISMARSPDEPEVIKTMLRKTIEISIELTGAELGSLIFLESKGAVVDSILARGKISPELSSELVESVLKDGLAGWVMHHRKIGLVNDTEVDDRWLMLPNQHYTPRSALALPIFSGQAQLSRSQVDTQTHTVGGTPSSSSSRHFSQVEAMRTVALTNDYIAQDNEMCTFATLFFAVLDPENGNLIYINGGMRLPLSLIETA